MKILIYSDIHLSDTSSIQRGRDDNLSNRLSSLIILRKEIQEIAKKYNVSMIIDGGDLMDSDIINSEELYGLSEFIKVNSEIEEYHLNGNHGLSFKSLNSASIVSIANLHSYVDEVTVLVKDSYDIIMIPYGYLDNFLSTKSDYLSNATKKIIISHEVIMTSSLYDKNDYLGKLSKYDNLLVFNGHIHKPEKFNNKVYNIGSSSGTGFGDGHNLKDTSTHPRVLIVDTDSMEVESIRLTTSNLFFNISSKDINKNLDLPNNVFLNIMLGEASEKLKCEKKLLKYSNIKGVKYSNSAPNPTTTNVSALSEVVSESSSELEVNNYCNEYIINLLKSKFSESDVISFTTILGGEL